MGESKDEEVMTVSAPAADWIEGSSHGPKGREIHPVCSGEERGKTHIGK